MGSLRRGLAPGLLVLPPLLLFLLLLLLLLPMLLLPLPFLLLVLLLVPWRLLGLWSESLLPLAALLPAAGTALRSGALSDAALAEVDHSTSTPSRALPRKQK